MVLEERAKLLMVAQEQTAAITSEETDTRTRDASHVEY